MSNKPNRYIRWLDRVADTESQASNAVLWTLIIISLIAGAVAVAIFKEPALMRVAAGLSAFAVALFPLENRFSAREKFFGMSVVPSDTPSPEITYGCYSYYESKSQPIPEEVFQYRAYMRAKFIYFPLGLFLCLSSDWLASFIL